MAMHTIDQGCHNPSGMDLNKVELGIQMVMQQNCSRIISFHFCMVRHVIQKQQWHDCSVCGSFTDCLKSPPTNIHHKLNAKGEKIIGLNLSE